jgi:MinD-like ATPase involved in chromosome partitioning or flagellar assembly
MAVYAFVSAKGSPGVTTTVVALSRAWQRATARRVLALDLDPSGGDVAAGVLLGSPPAGVGVLALATHRSDQPVEALAGAAVDLTGEGSLLVPGVPDVARAGAIPLAWDVVVAALPELAAEQTDVLVDGGRLAGAVTQPVWTAEADHVVMLVRPTLPAVTAAHRQVSSMPSQLPLGVVVIEAPSPYSAREVERAVERPLRGVLPFDPRSAAVHSEGARPDRNHAKHSYARAVDRLAVALTDLTSDGTGPTERPALTEAAGAGERL